MRAVIALPYAWLAVFFLLPFALVLGIALVTNAPDSVPPVELGFSLDNFRLLLSISLFLLLLKKLLQLDQLRFGFFPLLNEIMVRLGQLRYLLFKCLA